MACERKRISCCTYLNPPNILNNKFQRMAFNDKPEISDTTCNKSTGLLFRKCKFPYCKFEDQSSHPFKQRKHDRQHLNSRISRESKILNTNSDIYYTSVINGDSSAEIIHDDGVKDNSSCFLKNYLKNIRYSPKFSQFQTNRLSNNNTFFSAYEVPDGDNSDIKKTKLQFLTKNKIFSDKKNTSKRYHEDEKKIGIRIIQEINKYREKGNIAIKNCDFQLAVDYYTKAFSIEPKFKKFNSLLYSNAGYAFMKMDSCADAIEHFDKAIWLNPKNLKAKRRKILCLKNLNEIKNAEQEVLDLMKYSKSEKDKKLVIEILELKGDIYKDKGDRLSCDNAYVTALNSYSDAIYHRPSFELFIKRAVIYLNLKKLTEAIEDTTEALKIKPKSLEAREMKIKLLEFSGAPTEELVNNIKELQNLKDPEIIRGKLKEIYIKEGQNYENINKFSLAFGSYTNALQYDPYDPDLYRMRAEIGFQLNDYHSVINDTSEAIGMGSLNVNNWILRSKCLLKEGMFKDSFEDASLAYLQTKCPKVALLMNEAEKGIINLKDETHYDVLDVENNATNKEITKQFLKLSLRFDPDKLSKLNENYKNSFKERFKKILESYDTLNDPVKRSMYDISFLRETGMP